MSARATLALLAALAVACQSAPDESRAPASKVAILGEAYRLRSVNYVNADDGAPEWGSAFTDHYRPVFPAARDAFYCDLVSSLGTVFVLGSSDAGVPHRDGGRFLFDEQFNVHIAESSTLLDEGAMRPQADGRYSFSMLRALRTNEGLLTNSCRPFELPPGLSSTTTTPFGFERVEGTLEQLPESPDAWPRYAELFAGGLLDVDVHFGVVDEKEQQVRVARDFAGWLVQEGYALPAGVPTARELPPVSGPFTRTIETPVGPVSVEVRVFFGSRGTGYDPETLAGGQRLADLARGSLSQRDVVIFIGHAYGSDSIWTTATIPSEHHSTGVGKLEFVNLPLAGRSQVIVSEGCGTTSLTDALRANPASAGGATLDFLGSGTGTAINSDHVARETVRLLAGTDAAGHHVPLRYLAALYAMKYRHPIAEQDKVIRMVEFLDDNPTRHPWADPSRAGQPCVDGVPTCGEGALCMPTDLGARCTLECATSEGCDGLQCGVPIVPGRLSQLRPDEARYCALPGA